MATSRVDAINQIDLFQRKYFSPRWSDETLEGVLTGSIMTLDKQMSLGKSVDDALHMIIHGLVATVAVLKNIPITPDQMDGAFTGRVPYAEQVAPTLLVDALYPDASNATKDALISAIESGQISNTNLVAGIMDIGRTTPRPSAEAIIDAIYENGQGNPPLPVADLAFPGLNAGQVEFLVGVYVAAFSRAPEHDGLKYWAGDLARLLNSGVSQDDAMKEMAKAMYFAGAENGENGTGLDNAAYVRFVYETVLGRAPDAGGATYWTEQLEAGADRSTFITPFLTSALAADGDSSYVNARIAVAEYAAQAHVSGPGKTIDLAAVLSGVSSTADAYLAIQAMASAHPATITPEATLASMASQAEEIDLAAFAFNARVMHEPVLTPAADEANTISLIGVNAGAHDAEF